MKINLTFALLFFLTNFFSYVEARDMVITPLKGDREKEITQKKPEITLDEIQELKSKFNQNPQDYEVKGKLFRAYLAYAEGQLEEKRYDRINFHLKMAKILAKRDLGWLDEIAKIYFKIANQYVDAEDDPKAIHYAKQAHQLNPSNIRYRDMLIQLLKNLALEEYQNRHYHKASWAIRDAIQFGAEDVETFDLLGDIYYYDQKLAKAETTWKRGVAIAKRRGESGKSLEEKLKFLAKEKRIQEDQKHYSLAEFTISFDKRTSRKNVNQVKRLLESAYKEVTNHFKHYPRDKVAVIIYKAKDYSKVIGPGHLYIGALYDGKIRIPDKFRKILPEYFRALIYHEFTHALIHDLGGGKCPKWLNEGLAEYEERKIFQGSLDQLNRALREGTTLTPEQLLAWDLSDANASFIQLYYEQSYSMTLYLVKRYGIYKMKRFLRDLSKGLSFDETFYRYYKMKWEEFHNKWLKSF